MLPFDFLSLLPEAAATQVALLQWRSQKKNPAGTASNDRPVD
jgi:hypothetical protein